MILATTNTKIEKYNPDINTLLDSFTQYADVSQSSIRSYISGVRAFIHYLSQNNIRVPNRDTVLSYKKHLSKTKSASTIALYLSALRRFFAWCEAIKSPHIDSGHKKDCFTANQLKQIISGIERNGIKGKRDYALFCLISATGLRCVEVMRANIGDIRNIGGETCLFVQGKGKTSKSEFVKLSGHVLNAIKAYLDTRGELSENAPLFASLSHRNAGVGHEECGL